MRSSASPLGKQSVVGASRAKWWIFGVSLPLLPIGARVAAAWLDGQASLGFVDLFGDGELLVIATVIAAAIIGELMFDLRGARSVVDDVNSFRMALLNALALIVVVGSVLFFGLVTYANQARADAQTRARIEQFAEERLSAHLDIEAQAQLSQVRQLDSRQRQLERKRRALELEDAEQIAGQAGAEAGRGPSALFLQREIEEAARQSQRLKAQRSRLLAQAEQSQLSASGKLDASSANLNRGRTQAAIISVVMFLLSLAVAYPAVGLLAPRRLRAESDPTLAGPTSR
jgi:hypothetical protein